MGRILPGPVAGAPVFEDLSGLRHRRVKRWVRMALALGFVWAVAIGLLVFAPKDLPFAAVPPVAEAGSRSATAAAHAASDAGMLIELKGQSDREAEHHHPIAAHAAERPRCAIEEPAAGAAIAAQSGGFPSRVYALLPSLPENAFLPLTRNCDLVDVIIPERFEISGPGLTLGETAVDAEMLEVLGAIKTERGAAVQIWPLVNLGRDLKAQDFLDGLEDASRRKDLAAEIVLKARGMKADGACLKLQDVKARDAQRVVPFVAELARQAFDGGLELCLVAPLSDGLWSSAAITALVSKVIVPAYQEPWIGSLPQPLAPLDWFRMQVQELRKQVPRQKLVIALGGHAVDWVSGKAVPERISMAEAMFRISEANAGVEFSPMARNAYAAFVDRAGDRHQIWMLDAASVHNNLRVLDELGVLEVAMPSLGEEEPAYWHALKGEILAGTSSFFAAPEFPDNVIYSGDGAFYRLKAAARPGQRVWQVEAETGLIRKLRYEVIPRPLEMERYGAQDPRQIALTFDDGPDSVATARILDALKAQNAPATFFVVGKAALAAPELLQRAIDEGHIVGSHSFSHPHMEDLSPFLARAELSANRSLVEGMIGRSPLIYRPPYVRGPGPISEHEAMVFAALKDEGYYVAGSDIVPSDWAGISAEEIVRQVFDGLDKGGGNVIVLHDGRSTGMHTAEAVALLVPALRQAGYEIVPLPVLLGMTPEAVMPKVGLTASVFKGASVSAIGFWFWLLTAIFWVCILASVLRSLIYLALALRRDPVYPRSYAGLPSVTVVVPAYNEQKVIVSTLRSVLASDYPDLSCIVVDDGSTDGTLWAVRQAFGDDPRVRVLTQSNQGKWQALNHAFRRIETGIAVCVDADTRIHPDAIREIVRPFADSKVAAVAGTVEVADRPGLLTRFQSIEYITAQQIGRRAQEHLNGILVVPGALGAWRVEAVRDVGFYSNETLTEDADLTIWLRRGGFRVAYAERARSITEAPADVASLLKQRLRWSLGNLQTLWKHRGAFAEFGPRRLFSMIDMVFFGYVLPVLSPVLDVMFLIFLSNLYADWRSGQLADGLDMANLAVFAVAMVQMVDIALAWTAHRWDGRSGVKLILLVPLMNLLYRPLLYITVYRALWSALSGRLARWNKLRRLGMEPKRDLVSR